MRKICLWENDFFENSANIIIYFNGKRYKLNKQVLFVSSTLKSMMQGGFKESFKDEIKLDVDDITQDSWEMLLNYIYNKHIEFYSNIFKLNITSGDCFDLQKLTINNIIELYVASDFFDIDILISELKNILLDIINVCFRDNDTQKINSMIEYSPLISDIILFKLDKLSIDNIIKFICTLNVKNYSFNNTVFKIISKFFEIPAHLNNLYELKDYLEENNSRLSNLVCSLYDFIDPINKNILVNYFILNYPSLNINQIFEIFKTVLCKTLQSSRQSIHQSSLLSSHQSSPLSSHQSIYQSIHKTIYGSLYEYNDYEYNDDDDEDEDSDEDNIVDLGNGTIVDLDKLNDEDLDDLATRLAQIPDEKMEWRERKIVISIFDVNLAIYIDRL